MSREKTEPLPEELEAYLKDGGLIKKDCWINAMHLRYSSNINKFELVDSVSTSTGERILGVRERFDHLIDIPYAGYWIKCSDKGVPIE